MNISARHLEGERLIEDVTTALDSSGLKPRCLHLELTETALLVDVDAAAAALTRIRQLGVEVAVDDFGVQQSPLSYLQRLPLDAVKVDRAFVMDIGLAKAGGSIAAGVIGLADALGMSTVAEGVEHAHQAAVKPRRVGVASAVRLPASVEAGGDTARGDVTDVGQLMGQVAVAALINPSIRKAIDAIDDGAWTPIVYPAGGQAQVAETTYVTGRDRHERRLRLVVRRTRLTDPAQLRLSPDWRHHAFITYLDLPVLALDQFHRDHATVELAIRDLKEGAGMEHCPSGQFFANAGWLGCAVLAHNLVRWTARLVGVHPDDQLTVARIIRSRVLALLGRLVNRSGQHVLRLPERWPWATMFLTAPPWPSAASTDENLCGPG